MLGIRNARPCISVKSFDYALAWPGDRSTYTFNSQSGNDTAGYHEHLRQAWILSFVLGELCELAHRLLLICKLNIQQLDRNILENVGTSHRDGAAETGRDLSRGSCLNHVQVLEKVSFLMAVSRFSQGLSKVLGYEKPRDGSSRRLPKGT